MKRYIVFFGDMYSLGGGSNEIIGHCSSVDEGKEMVEKHWYEIWKKDWSKHMSFEKLKDRDQADIVAEVYDCKLEKLAWRFGFLNAA